MTPNFTGAAAQTLKVEITNGDMIDVFQAMDFVHFHAKAMEKSGNNLKPLGGLNNVLNSDYLVQVKNQDGNTVGQCRLKHYHPNDPTFGNYPAPENGFVLASLSGLKHFPLMIDALQQEGLGHITLKTRSTNEAGKKIMESCGFVGGAPGYAGDDDYESVFYGLDLSPSYTLVPSGSLNHSPVSLGEAVYAPSK